MHCSFECIALTPSECIASRLNIFTHCSYIQSGRDERIHHTLFLILCRLVEEKSNQYRYVVTAALLIFSRLCCHELYILILWSLWLKYTFPNFYRYFWLLKFYYILKTIVIFIFYMINDKIRSF